MLSALGTQLTLIAFPWLVLKVTGDALIMGTVVAVSAIPRAIFMIVGGAFTDRFSPRAVLLWVNWLRTVLMVGLAVLVFMQWIPVWLIYVIALLFGLIDAFQWPASSAILPRLLPPESLPAGNSLVQGVGQLSLMIGPALAGLLIALFADEAAADMADLPGIALVFFVDGLSYIVAAVTLLMISLPGEDAGQEPVSVRYMIASMLEGFVVAWQDLPVRMVTIMFTIFSLFFRGPYMVGVPLLSDLRFDEGALAFGMISSAFGVGSLIGLVMAGSLPRPPERYYGRLALLDILVIGMSLIAYAFAPRVEWAMLASSLAGVTDSYLVIILISWLQVRVPAAILGRVMGMMMFFMQGVTPVSAAITGALMRISLEGVLVGAGTILMVLTLIGAMFPVVRSMGMDQRHDKHLQ